MSTMYGPWRHNEGTNTTIQIPQLPYIPGNKAREDRSSSEGTILTTQQESEEETSLSKLFDFYIEEIVSQIKYFHSYADRKKLRDALEKKTCDRRCNRIDFSYQDSVIFRHAKEPAAHEFARRLIELDYRYCKDCHRLMPKSSARITKVRTYSETPAPLCPCCNSRMANVAVLIRKTKMKDALFKFEGY